MQTPQRVLVTGATGFLGHNILRALSTRTDVHVIAACRTPARLARNLVHEVRAGDLREANYRRELVREVDVICHAGTWGAFWGHADLERRWFLEPARDLMNLAVEAGVRRFVQNSSVVVPRVRRDRRTVAEDAAGYRSGRWPHLDRLVDLEEHMQALRGRGTELVVLRLGHFVGRGNTNGMLAALAPRLRTGLVPWLGDGRSRLPLVADTDLGEAFALAATVPKLAPYQCFNICGPAFPTAREVLGFVAKQAGAPLPRFSVPYALGYAFGWLMEAIHPLLPGRAPFLTRSIVHVSEDWYCDTGEATAKLGYQPKRDWQQAAAEALEEIAQAGYPWPALRQEVGA